MPRPRLVIENFSAEYIQGLDELPFAKFKPTWKNAKNSKQTRTPGERTIINNNCKKADNESKKRKKAPISAAQKKAKKAKLLVSQLVGLVDGVSDDLDVAQAERNPIRGKKLVFFK